MGSMFYKHWLLYVARPSNAGIFSFKNAMYNGLIFFYLQVCLFISFLFLNFNADLKRSQKKRPTKVNHLGIVADTLCTEANLSSVWARLKQLPRISFQTPVMIIVWEFEKLTDDIFLNQMGDIQVPWCPWRPYYKINKRRKC